MRISDWSSDVCSSDLRHDEDRPCSRRPHVFGSDHELRPQQLCTHSVGKGHRRRRRRPVCSRQLLHRRRSCRNRSEEHTSELQSLMRISYAVFCLKKKTNCNEECHTCTDYRHTNVTYLNTTT